MTELILERQNLTYLQWSKIRHSSGTAGSFLKASSEISGSKVYYKLSNYDSINGVVGHESVNEFIVDRLLNILGIEHVHYNLIHADININGRYIETYLCSSDDFKNRGEEKAAFDIYYELEKHDNESPIDFCIRLGFEKYIYEMFLVDFLIMNRDRHGANIEVLKNPKKKTIRLAPLFDHGLSLLAPCLTEESIARFDVLADKPIQNFLGSNSSFDNLKLIPKDKLPYVNPLTESDKNEIFDGLCGVISKSLTDKIWEMIWRRWRYYEDFCNNK